MGLWSGFNTSIQPPAGKSEKEIAQMMGARYQSEVEARKEQKRRAKVAGKNRSQTREDALFEGRETLKERRFKVGMKRDAEAQRKALIESSAGGQALKKFGESSFQVGKQVGQAAMAARRQEVDFSAEQQMLGQMFGQGDKIWGINNQPVTINHDLNSGRADPFDETSSLFGFGGQSERSGLF